MANSFGRQSFATVSNLKLAVVHKFQYYGHIHILFRTGYWPQQIQAFNLLVPVGAY
jgi:hypothetical protein